MDDLMILCAKAKVMRSKQAAATPRLPAISFKSKLPDTDTPDDVVEDLPIPTPTYGWRNKIRNFAAKLMANPVGRLFGDFHRTYGA